jgi:multidrug efflux system membrane fusion protein
MNRSYLLALAIALVAAGWVISGQMNGANEVPAPATAPTTAGTTETQTAAAEPARVRVRTLKAEQRSRDIVLRGRTEAIRSVDLKAEIPGRISKIIAAKGQLVRRGDTIVRLAMEDRQEKLIEAKALVSQRQMEYDAAAKLRKKGFRAETQLAAATANLEAASAYVARIEVNIDQTEIRAPFAGIVERRPVELGDYLKAGSVVATIVDQDPYLVVGQVSEREVSYLRRGMPGTARLPGGQEMSGKLRFIATKADPLTRTFRVELRVPNTKRLLRDGLTAELRIAVETVSAHFVSPALLTLDDGGVIGLKTVNAEGVVEFHPVRIFSAGATGVWLAGLPENVRAITVGQEFVRPGERVTAVAEAGSNS